MNLQDQKSFLLDGLALLSEEVMTAVGGGYGGGQSGSSAPGLPPGFPVQMCPVCGSWGPNLRCSCNRGYGR